MGNFLKHIIGVSHFVKAIFGTGGHFVAIQGLLKTFRLLFLLNLTQVYPFGKYFVWNRGSFCRAVGGQERKDALFYFLKMPNCSIPTKKHLNIDPFV